MQCPNCGFQNMPGSEVCARCSTSLQLAAVAMDVHPPRARGAGAYRRRLALARTRAINFGEQIRDFNERKREQAAERANRFGSSWPIIWRLIIPGWAQWYTGQWWQGVFFFVLVLLLAIASIADFGSTNGTWCFAGLFTVHLWSVLDVFNSFLAEDTFLRRRKRAFLVQNGIRREKAQIAPHPHVELLNRSKTD